METSKKVEEWAKRMGYKGKFPDSFKDICGPSTAHIWERLVANLKLKQEIEHIRKNLIINNLKRGTNTNVPIKTIQVYDRRQKLEREISNLEDDISEKSQELDALDKNIKLKRALCGNLKHKVRDNRQTTYLYQQKLDQLEAKLPDAQEKLDCILSITPTEEHQDDEKVLETLKTCAEKVRQSIEKGDVHGKLENVMQNRTLRKTTEDGPSLFSQSLMDNKTMMTMIEDFTDEKTDSYLQQCADDALRDGEFSKDIKEILVKSNASVAWRLLSKMIYESNMKLVDAVNNKNFSTLKPSDEEDNLINLYAVDIEDNLLSIKYDKQIDYLNTVVNKKKTEILEKMDGLNISSTELNILREIFSLQLKEVCINATVTEQQRILATLKDDGDTRNELNSIRSKCMEASRKAFVSKQRISSMLQLYKQTHQDVISSHHKMIRHLKQLRNLSENLGWLSPLTENLNTREIEMFKKYNFGCHSKTELNGRTVLVRDIFPDTLDISDMDLNTLQTVSTLIENIDGSPEIIFAELLGSNTKLCQYQSQISTPHDVKYEKYSLENLEQRDVSTNQSLGKLSNIMKECESLMVKCNIAEMQTAMTLWTEMPVKDYVSRDRLFDGKPFSYYQKLYDSFCDRL